jgi:hypothetical protein
VSHLNLKQGNSGMNASRVYRDKEGGFWAPFCETGRLITEGKNVSGMRGCTSMFCTCGIDSDIRPATAEETLDFWETMGQMADERRAENQKDR